MKTASLGTPVDALPKPLMEEDTLKIVTVVKVVEDETGYLWHSFEKCSFIYVSTFSSKC